MNDPFKDIASLKSEKLTPPERDLLRAKLLREMDTYANTPLREPRFRVFGGKMYRYKRAIGYALVSLFAVSTGASYASADALPGDVLYPIKIHVRERIEGAVAINPKASAEFAQKQIVRRAIEAEILTKEDRFDDVKKDQLREETRTHVDAYTEARIRIERKGGKDEVEDLEEKMQRTVNDHEDALRAIGVVTEVGTSTKRREGDTRAQKGLRGRKSEFFARPLPQNIPNASSSSLILSDDNDEDEYLHLPLRKSSSSDTQTREKDEHIELEGKENASTTTLEHENVEDDGGERRVRNGR